MLENLAAGTVRETRIHIRDGENEFYCIFRTKIVHIDDKVFRLFNSFCLFVFVCVRTNMDGENVEYIS